MPTIVPVDFLLYAMDALQRSSYNKRLSRSPLLVPPLFPSRRKLLHIHITVEKERIFKDYRNRNVYIATRCAILNDRTMKAAGATLRAGNPLYPTREVAQSSSQASKGCLKLMPQSWQISSPEIPLQEVLVSSETEQSDKRPLCCCRRPSRSSSSSSCLSLQW